MTIWQKVVNLFNYSGGRLEAVTRGELLNQQPHPHWSRVNSVDTYRSLLQAAGYLREVEAGKWERVRPIPPGLSIQEAKKQAGHYYTGKYKERETN